jgi:hypothetical protein
MSIQLNKIRESTPQALAPCSGKVFFKALEDQYGKDTVKDAVEWVFQYYGSKDTNASYLRSIYHQREQNVSGGHQHYLATLIHRVSDVNFDHIYATPVEKLSPMPAKYFFKALQKTYSEETLHNVKNWLVSGGDKFKHVKHLFDQRYDIRISVSGDQQRYLIYLVRMAAIKKFVSV